MREFSFVSLNEGATAACARGVAAVLRGGDTVLLRGGLGAGKTTLVRGIADALGVAKGLVSSPTFVIVNQYPVNPTGTTGKNSNAGVTEVAHVDAYRLTGPDDLESVGWDRLFDEHGRARGDVVALVEWPERIAAVFKDVECAEVLLELQATASARKVTLRVPDSWRERPGVEPLLSRAPIECRTTREWVAPTASTYPFASERARMADLNKWFTGSYTISRPATPSDFEE